MRHFGLAEYCFVAAAKPMRFSAVATLLICAMPIGVVALPAPAPTPLTVYGDWIVGCDNVNSCHATSLDPEDSVDGRSTHSGTSISVKRDAAGRSPANVRISLNSVAGELSQANVAMLMVDETKLAVDFKYEFDGEYEKGIINLPPCSDRSVIEDLLRAKTLYLLDRKGNVLASASLTGRRDALVHIDTAQKRNETDSALVFKGEKLFKGPADTPPYPLVRVPERTWKAPAQLNAAVTEQARAFYNCRSAEMVMRNLEIKYVRLDRNNTLAIIPALCGTGAYNSTVRVAILDNEGRMRRPLFDMTAKPEQPDQFINGWWDEADGLLSSYAKSRGVGDCGLVERYAWDGHRFRLAERSEMSECRGSTDYITTWRAKVEHRRAR
jgi:Protein of unknown function (DUF1176)